MTPDAPDELLYFGKIVWPFPVLDRKKAFRDVCELPEIVLSKFLNKMRQSYHPIPDALSTPECNSFPPKFYRPNIRDIVWLRGTFGGRNAKILLCLICSPWRVRKCCTGWVHDYAGPPDIWGNTETPRLLSSGSVRIIFPPRPSSPAPSIKRSRNDVKNVGDSKQFPAAFLKALTWPSLSTGET